MTEYPRNETVPERIFKDIAAKIQSGALLPGDQLPGDRPLAETYQVSRNSMIAALQMLQQKGYIDRIPMQGSFVRKNVEKITGEVKIFCPLPEKVMLPARIGFANFINENEIQQGLAAEAYERNFSVTFRHMEDVGDALVLRRQLEVITEIADAVVFIGPQFARLRDLIAERGIPAVIIEPNPLFRQETIPSVSYNRDKAFADLGKRICRTGCRTFTFLYMKDASVAVQMDVDYRMRLLEEHLTRAGVEVSYRALPHSDQVQPELLDELERVLGAGPRPDVVCCTHFPVITAVQYLATAKQWGLGETFHVFGHTGGGIFSLAYPPVPYWRVPCFELGRVASEMLCDCVAREKKLKSMMIEGVVDEGGR